MVRSRSGSMPDKAVRVRLGSHCWKGTILRRAESVQNVIHLHKIQHISE